jgi:hypothetical protein
MTTNVFDHTGFVDAPRGLEVPAVTMRDRMYLAIFASAPAWVLVGLLLTFGGAR